ncbi:MAG: CoA transferase, partial [Dehalococcoidia bacterium]
MEPLPLAGVRVLEIGGGIPAAFATRWMAGFGADVVRTEGPPGSLTADEETYLLASKRRIAPPAAELPRLALAAAILVEDGKPGTLAELGLDPGALRRATPGLVIVSITPFGQSGPYAAFEATNIVSFAMGGIMSITGSPDAPPLQTGGSQAQYLGGLHAFGAALSAYYGSLVHGEGDWVDISLQECAAGMLELFGPRTEYMDTGPHLRSGNHVSAVEGIYPTADGYGGVCTLARQIPALFQVVAHPAFEDPRFHDPITRLEVDDELRAILYAWFATRTRAEILDLGRKHRIPFGAVLSPADLLASPALAARHIFDSAETPAGEVAVPGRPVRGRPRAPRP